MSTLKPPLEAAIRLQSGIFANAVARLQEYIDGMQGKTETVTTAGINLIHQMSAATDDDSPILASLFSKEVFFSFSFGFGLGCVFICSLSTIVIWVKNRVCRKNEKYADILKQSGTAKQAGRFSSTVNGVRISFLSDEE